MENRTLEKKGRVATQPSEVSETYLFTGLCATCAVVDTCISAKNSGYPVVECEEYEEDGRTFSETVEVRTLRTREKVKPLAKTPEEEAVVEGLCETCVHRETCTFPRVEGGVWHCEEYA
jgi:hypothetical protein